MKQFRIDLRSTIAVVAIAATMVCMQGCATVSPATAVQDIANAIPEIQADINLAASLVTTFDPAAQVVVTTAVNQASAALVELRTLCGAYTASPNTSTLLKINDVLNAALNDSAQRVLDAAKIVDPKSRETATRVLGAIQAGLLLTYAIYQHVQSKAQIKSTALARTYQLRDVAPYLARDKIETATGVPFKAALAYETAQGF